MINNGVTAKEISLSKALDIRQAYLTLETEDLAEIELGKDSTVIVSTRGVLTVVASEK